MKSRKLLLFIMLFYPLFIFGQAWDFPTKQGMEEWIRINSKEKLKLCQIPDTILTKVSTAELAELCIKYPLFYEYTAFNDERKAISLIIDSFNGLKELSERKDGTIALMQIYSQMKIQEKEGYVEKGKYNSVLHFEFIELLLSSENFINQLSVEKQKELKKITISKYGEKLKYIDIYGISGIKNSLLLSSIIINRIEPNNKNSQLIKEFIKDYKSIDSKQLEIISKINIQSNE